MFSRCRLRNSAVFLGAMEETELKIFPLESGPAATYGYLLTDKINNTAVVIDVPYEAAAVFQDWAAREQVAIRAILLTHSHWDHTADAAALKRATSAPVYVHKADEYRLTEPMQHTIWPLPFTIESVSPDVYLDEGTELQFGAWKLSVIHVPGHSEGSVCFLDRQRKLAFAGDVLFAGSIGRTDLPGGDMKTLMHSITSKMFALDDATQVLPGHGPRTTIGRERMTNPFLVEG